MFLLPEPPVHYTAFVARYPKLGQTWEGIAEAGREGPLDEHTARLIKLAIAVGATREGAVHASVRKILAIEISRAKLEQVVALAAGTLGFPSTVTVHTWVQDLLPQEPT